VLKITTDLTRKEFCMAKRTAIPTPAEVFPPGDFIREELEARGWSQGDLAAVLGRPLQAVNQIVNGRKRITEQTAAELAQAFGTSAELWLTLETGYRLSLVKDVDPRIARRAQRLTTRA
jgi:HTH-type transcriptional regulator/antitoxin HigA